MAALDYKSEIDAQAWALLRAKAGFVTTFLPGNQISDDPRAPTQRTIPRSPKKATIDIRLEDGNPIGQNVPRTFGPCDLGIPLTVKLIVIMTFDPKATKADRFAAETLVRSAWLGAWPKFGLAYVTGFTISETDRVQRAKQQPQNLPIIITQTLTFNLRPLLSQLVG